MNYREVFSSSRTLAVIGCSADPYRTSYGISRQMQNEGYKIIPINPDHDEILDEKCYDSIASVPTSTPIDIVVIFRNMKFTEQMVESIVNWSDQSGKQPIIWTQFNVSSPGAEELASKNGFTYVKNRCIAVEYAKFGRQ